MEVEQLLARRSAVHAALGEPARLRIVDALIHSDLSPSELGELVGVDSNLLAHHLDVLAGAGVVARSSSHGDRRRRYLRVQPSGLGLIHEPLALVASTVLFVCTANSARSQLAAGLWNAARPDIPASSAGTEPAAAVHPGAVRTGGRRGLDLTRRHPRSLDDADASADLVVTVCDRAHEQLRRRPIHARRLLHWSIADPADAGTSKAFDAAADELQRRIDDLTPHVSAPAGRAHR